MKKKINRNYWKAEEEIILKNWADKAQCYQWMHSKCREIYQSKNAWFSIPVIIISTVTGTANFAQDRFSDDIKPYIVMTIGTLSIIAGIITTIYQFLNISELNEGHRVAMISWGKFHNNVKTIVLRHPLDRMSPNETIKIYQDEYDRLIEVSPVIIKPVIIQFERTFKKNSELIKPEICSKLNTTQMFTMSTNERQEMINKLNNITVNKKLVDTFCDLNGRDPMENELDDDDNININIEINSDSDISDNNNILDNNSISDNENSDNDNSDNDILDNTFINTSNI